MLTTLLLAALVAGALAGPISYNEPITQCATTCPDDADFPYVPGTTYTYGYESTMTTHIPGSTEQTAQMFVTATANIEVLGRCEMALRMSDVSLEDVNPVDGTRGHVTQAYEFKRSVQDKTLRFSLVNGRVADVCPEDGEQPWVLNIKRAVLSGLQITVPSDIDTTTTVTESDVVGDCEAVYSPHSTTWNSKTLRKTKDLLACTGRQDTESWMQSVHYNMPSRIQSLPILKSTHECEQTMNADGRIINVVCQENHLFRPFSRENSGATTSVTYRLTMTQEQREIKASMNAIPRRTDLKFEYEAQPDEVSTAQRVAVNVLRELCENTEQGITDQTPGIFLKLVKELRKMDSAALVDINQQTTGAQPCQRARKFFLDALPTLSTPAALGVMKDLVISGDVTGVEAELWMTSLSFIVNPTKEMLTQVTPLLSTAEPMEKAILGISSMVHSYCKTHPNCARENEVIAVVTAIEGMLNRNCESDNQKKISIALKALGNAGQVQRAVPTLMRCYQNTRNPMETRIFAVQAFRRMGCTMDREPMMRLLEDTTSDSELRINAYLMLMQCPDHATIQHLTRLLQSEEVNQVGSFIWTHLTNIAESSSPVKQEIQRLLSMASLRTLFDMDKRKFSRNVEWSAYSETLNSGASLDSNLIWSPQSFIPRSASVNLTVDLFGQSVNLMEVGGRVEGLDSVLESFFGPEDSEDDTAEPTTDIAQLDSKFRNTDGREPQGSYYLRVFGNEVNFDEFRGLDINSIKDRFNYLQWLLDLANDHEFSFTKSMALMDTEICIPTIAGLPLRLAVDGAATTDLELRGKMDLRNLMANPRNLAIVGSIRPSAAVQIKGEMGIDAVVARSGIRMVNTFHTSTFADGTIELENGRIFNVDINMPHDSMDIFNVENKFFVTYRDQAIEQLMITDGRYETNECSGAGLETTLGLQMCGHVSVPKVTAPGAPWIPLTGPLSAGLRLTKTDTFTKYHFETKLYREKLSPGIFNYVAGIQFDTPGSAIDREFTARFNFNDQDNSVALDLRSPWKKLGLAGALEYSDDTFRGRGSINIDDAHTYGVALEHIITKNQYNTRYQPRIEVTIPGGEPYVLGGSVIYRPRKRVEVDLYMENVLSSAVTLKGELTQSLKAKQSKYEGDVALRLPGFKSQLAGGFELTKARDEVNSALTLQAKYKYKGEEQNSFSLTNNVQYQAGPVQKIDITGETATSVWPQYDTDYSVMFGRDASMCEMSIHSGLTNDKPKRFSFAAKAIHDFDTPQKQLTLQTSLDIPFKSLAYSGELIHQHNQNDVSLNLDATINGEKADAALLLKKDGVDLSAQATLSYTEYNVGYFHSLSQKQNREYHHNLTLTRDQHVKVQVLNVYKMTSKHELTGSMVTPWTPDMSLDASFLPNIENMNLNIHTTYGEDVYSLVSTWNHRYSGGELNSRTNWILTIPAHVYTASGDLRKTGQSVSSNVLLKWDPEHDSTKKIVCDIDMNLSPSDPTLSAKVQWWPNKFVDLNGSLKMVDVSREMECVAHITTSFVGYEDINGIFKYDLTPTHQNIQGEATWASAKKIEVIFVNQMKNGPSNMETSLSINTPFSQLRHAAINTEHNLQDNTFTSNSNIRWNSKQITLESNLSKHGTWSQAEGTIVLNTPFDNLSIVKFEGNYNINGRIPVCNGKIQYNDKVIELSTTETEQGTLSGDFTHVATVKVTTPFTALNTLILTSEVKKQETSLVTKSKVQWNTKEIALETNTIIEDYSMNKFSTDILFTSPIADFEKVHFTLNNMKNGNVVESTTQLIIGEEVNSITFSMNHDVKGSAINNQGSLGITIPYINRETNTVEWTHTYSDNSITTHVDAFMFGEKTVLDISGKLRRKKQISVKFHTPSLEPIAVKFSHEGDRRTISLTTEVDASYGTQTIKAQNKFSYQPNNGITLEIKVETPIEGYEEITLIMDDHITARQVNLHNELKWGAKNQITFDSTVTHNMPEFEGQLQFLIDIENVVDTTKYSINLSNTKIKNLWTVTGNAKINDEVIGQGTVMLGVEDLKKLNVNFVTTAPSLSPYIGKVMFDFENQGTLRNSVTKVQVDNSMLAGVYYVEANVNVERDISVNLLFRCPTSGTKSLAFTHHGSLTNFRTQCNVVYEPSKEVTANLEFAHDAAKTTGKFESNVFEDVAVTIEHTGTLSKFNTKGDIQIAEHKITGTGQFELSGTTLDLSANLDTTFECMKSVVINVNHEGGLTAFTNSFNANVNGDVYSATSEFHGNNGKLHVSTPTAELNTLNVEFEHEGFITDFSNKAIVELNGNHYNMENIFKVEGSDMILESKLNVPEEISFKVKHNGGLRDFTNNAIFKYFNQVYTSNNIFKIVSGTVEIKSVIETPLQGFRSAGIEYNHNGGIDNFVSNLIMNIEESRITGKYNLKVRGNDITQTLDIRTPFEGYQTIGSNLKHVGPWNNFNNDFSAHIYDSAITSRVTLKINAESVESSVEISTPFELARSLNFELKATVPETKFSASVNGEAITGEYSFKEVNNAYNGIIKLNTPFTIVRVFDVSATHTGDLYNFVNDLEVTLNQQSITMNTIFSPTEGSMTLRTPFTAVTELIMSFKHTGGMRNFENEASIRLNDQVITGTSTFKMSPRIEGTLSIKTPIQVARTIDITFNHNGLQSNSFTMKVNDKLVSLAQEYRPTEGTLTMRTPFTSVSELIVSFKHTGGIHNFENEASITLNGQVITGTSTFKMSPKIEGTLSIETPFQVARTIDLTFTHNGLQSNDLRMKVNEDIFSLAMEYQPTEGTLTMRTPFSQVSNLIVSFKHTGGIRNFENEASITLNGQVITGTSTFKMSPKIEGTLSIETPFQVARTIDLTFTHNGLQSNNLVMKVNDQVFSLAMEYQPTEGTLTMRTPFAQVLDLIVSFKHTGGIRNFENEASITLNGQVITGTSTFKMSPKIEGTLSIKTPFQVARTIDVTFNHNGLQSNDLMMKVNDHVFSLAMEYQPTEGALTMRTPFAQVSDLIVSFKHTGGIRNFENEASITLNGQVITGTSTFKMSPKIEGTLSIKTPFQVARTIDATFDHNGLQSNNLMMKVNDHVFSLAMEYQPTEGTLTMRTPFAQVSELIVSFKHTGGIRNFENEASITLNGQVITGTSTFKMSPKIEGTLSIKTPFQVARNIDVTFDHNGLQSNDLMMKVNDHVFSLAMEYQPTEGTVTMRTPFAQVSELIVSFKHTGGIRNFENDVRISLNGNVITGTSSFIMTPTIQGSLKINTPYSFLQKLDMTFNHIDLLNNQFTLTFNDDVLSLDTSYQPIEGSLTLHTPFVSLSEVIASFKHTGDRRSFENEAKISLNGKVIIGSSSFTMTPKIEGTLKLNTPFTELSSVDLVFNHDGQRDNFNNMMRLLVNNKEFSIETMYMPTEASLTLRTPFASVSELVVSGKHTGQLNNFANDITVTLNGQTATSTINFQPTQGTLTIRTPLTQVENIIVSFRQNGNLQNFEGESRLSLNGNEILGTAIFKMSPRIEGKLKVTTPFTSVRTIDLAFNHEGQLQNFNNMFRLLVDENEFSIDAAYQPIEGSLAIRTPFPEVSKLDVSFKHTGQRNTFANEITVNFNDQVFTMSSNYSPSEGTLTLNTPFSVLSEVVVSFKHTGTLNNFQNEVNVNFNRQQYSLVAQFQPTEGSLTLNTPFTLVREFIVTFKNSGDITNFVNEGRISLNGNEITGTSTFKSTPRIEGTLVIDLPFTSLRKIDLAFNHEGQLENLNSMIKLIVNDQVYSLDASFKPIEGSLTLITPFDSVSEFIVTFKHAGQQTNFNNEMSLSLNGQRITASSTFTPTEGSLVVHTPFTTVSEFIVSFKHTGQLNNFQNEVIVNLNGQEMNLVTVYQPTHGTITLTTPLSQLKEFSLSFKHSGETNNFRNEVSASLNSQVISVTTVYRPNNGQFTLRTPFSLVSELSASFQHTGEMRNFEDHIAFSLNGETLEGTIRFNMADNIEGSLAINNPFGLFRMLNVEFNHRGELRDFNNQLSVSIDSHTLNLATNFRPTEGLLTLQTSAASVSEFIASFKHKGDITFFENNMEISLNGEGITASSNFKLSDLSGNLNINSPFAIARAIEVTLKNKDNQGDIINRDLIISVNDHVLSLDVTYNPTEGSMTLRTPFTSVNEFIVSYKFIGSTVDFENEITVSLNGVSVSGISKFQKAGNNLDGSIKVMTPFNYFRTFDVTVKHEEEPKNHFKTDLGIAINDYVVTLNTFLNILDEGIEGNLLFTAPFINLQKVQFSLDHKHIAGGFTNECAMNFNDYTYTSDISFENLRGNIQGSLAIRTPLAFAEQIDINVKHTGTLKNFNNELVINLNGVSLDGSSKFILSSTVLVAEVKIATPFSAINSFDLSVKHDGIPSNFKNSVDIVINDLKMSANSEFKRVSYNIEGTVSIDIPGFKTGLTCETTNTGRNSFTNVVRATLNDHIVTAENQFKTADNVIEGSLNINYNTKSLIVISYRHNGNFNNFENEMSFTLLEQTITTNTAFNKASDKIDGSLRISTPFTAAQSMAISFSHEGALDNSKNQLVVMLNGDEVTLNNELKYANNHIEGLVNVIVGDVDIFTVGLTHTGDLYDFTNEGYVTIKQQTVRLNNAFKIIGNALDMSLRLDTPFEMCDVIAIEIIHSGELKDFNNKIVLTFNENTVSKTTVFKYDGTKVDGSVSFVALGETVEFVLAHSGDLSDFTTKLTTVIDKIKAYEIAIHHAGSLADFNNQVTFSIYEDRFVMDTRFKLDGNSLDFAHEILTPLPFLPSVTTIVKHTGPLDNFNGELLMSVNGEELLKVLSRFRVQGNEIHCDITVNEYTLGFHHNGENSNFIDDLTLSINGEQASFSSVFQMNELGLTGNARVNTPFKGYRTMAVSATRRGNDLVLSMEREEDKYGLTTASSDSSMSFTLMTPLTILNKLAASISYEGTPMHFNQISSLEYNEHKFAYDLEFKNSGDNIETKITIETPLAKFRNVEIFATHEGRLAAFSNNGYIVINGQRYTAQSEFRLSSNEMHFMAKSALPEEYSLTLDCSGTWDNFRKQALMKYNGNTISSNVNWQIQRAQMSLSAVINTPYSGFETIKSTFNHNGGLSSFRQSSVTEYGTNAIRHNIDFTINGNELNGLIKVLTPFTLVRHIELSAAHSGHYTKFNCNSHVIINNDRYTAESAFDYQPNDIHALLKFNVPAEYSLKWDFSGQVKDFTNDIIAKYNNDIFSAKTTFELGDDWTMNTVTVLNSPFENYEQIQFTYNHSGRPTNFRCTSQLEMPGKTMQFLNEFSLSGNTAIGKFQLESPFEIIPSINGEFSHSGRLDDMTSNGKIIVRGDILLKYAFKIQGQGVEGDFLVNSVIPEFHIVFHHAMESAEFDNNFTVSYGGETVIESGIHMNSNRVNGNAKLNTPINGYRRMAVSFEKSPSKYQLQMQKDERELSFESTNQRTEEGRRIGFTVSTPFEIVRRITGSISHEGTANNFNQEAVLQYNHNRIEYTLNFAKTSDKIDGKFKLMTPFSLIENIEIALTHNGSPMDFNNNGHIVYNGQRYTANSEFRFTRNEMHLMLNAMIPEQYKINVDYNNMQTNKYDIVAELKTPLSGYETVVFKFNHQGSLRNFQQQTSLVYGGNTAEQKLVFRFQDGEVNTEFSLNTPDNVFNVKIDGNGNVKAFNGQITIIMGNKEISKSINWRLNGNTFDATATLKTPFTNLENINLNINHQGPLTNMRQSAVLQYAGNTVSYNGEWKKVGDEMSAKFIIQSPFDFIEHIEIGGVHTGPITNFQNNAYIMRNGQKVEANSEFRISAQEGHVLFKSGQIEFAYDYNGTPLDFTSELAVKYGTNEFKKLTVLKKDGNSVNMDTTVNTPFSNWRTTKFTYSHQGSLTNFNQNALVEIYGFTAKQTSEFKKAGNTVHGKFCFEHDVEINTSVDFEMTKLIKVEFSHEGGLRNFENSAKLEFNKDHVFEASSSLKVYSAKIVANVALKVPNEYSSSVIIKGEPTDFTGKVRVTFDNEESTLNFAHTRNNDVKEASVTIRTPYDGFNQFSAESRIVTRSGLIHVTGSIATPFVGYEIFELEFKNDIPSTSPLQFRTTGKLNTPFNEISELTFELNHSGTITNFNSNGNVNFNGQVFSGTVISKHENKKIESKVSFQSPYFTSANFELKHEGGLRNFNTAVMTNLDDDKIESTVSFRMTPTLVFKANLKTPSVERHKAPFVEAREIILNVNHNGNIRDFNTDAFVSLNGDKVEGSVNFKLRPAIILTAMLKTPFTEAKEMTLNFNFNGNKFDFNTAAVLGLNGQKVEGTLKCKVQPNVEISTVIEQNLFTDVARKFEININHDGELRDFTSTASASMDGKTISSEVKFKINGEQIEGSVKLNIPYYETITFTLKHNGAINNFQTFLSFVSPLGQTYGLELRNNGELTNFESAFVLTTPHEQLPRLAGDIKHVGPVDDFITTASLNIGSQRLEGETKFKKTTRRSKTNVEYMFRMTTPFSVLRDFHIATDHQLTTVALSGKGEATYNGEKYFDADYNVGFSSVKSLNINMRAPYVSSVSFAHSSQNNIVSGDASFTWRSDAYTVNYALKNNRELTITTTIPSRTIKMTTAYSLTRDNFSNNMAFQWSDNAADKLTWDIDMTRSTRGNQMVYDGRLVIVAKEYRLATTLAHRVTSGRQYVTELNVQGLILRSDILLKQPNAREFTATFTAQHPSFSKDVVFALESLIEPEKPRVQGRVTLEYADQHFDVSGKFADESESRREKRYVAEAHVIHPASALNVQFTSHLKNSDETMGGDMEVSYMMARDRNLKNAALRAEINKIRDEINMELGAGPRSMSVTGRRTVADTESGHHHFSVSGMMDERNLQAEIDMHQTNPSFDFTFSLDPQMEMHVYGKYVDPSSIMIEAYRENQGTRVQDSQMSLRLTDNHIVNARAFFRPQIIDELKNLLSTNTELGAAVSQLSSVITDEYNEKTALLAQAIIPLTASFDELKQNIVSTYENMYSSNVFYTRDISDAVSQYYSALSAKFNERWAILSEEYRAHFARKAIEIRQMNEEVKSFFDKVKTEAVQVAKELYAAYAEHYDHSMGRMEQIITETMDYVRSHPRMQDLVEKMSSMSPTEYLLPLHEQYERHVAGLANIWEEVWEVIPLPSFVRTWAEQSIQDTEWLYQYLEVDDAVKGWIAELHQAGIDEIAERSVSWLKNQLKRFTVNIITWAPRSGEAEVEVTLPLEIKDLRTMPDLSYDITGRFKEMLDYIKSHLPTLNLKGSDWSVWDTYYTYRPAFSPSQWVPPYSSHATIAGNQHFMTFDKTFYDFAGECSYLLARDFIDGRFSVIVNYDQTGKKSLTVNSGRREINIQPNFKIRVDGERTELPYVAGLTTARRIGNTVQIDNKHGITVTCDLVHDHCTVYVTGWYFGKTGGLLGTYDNEQSNDFLTVERVPATSTEQFAASWSIGSTCREVNHATNAGPTLDSDKYNLCARYFEQRNSPLRPCFRQVDTEAFMSMCLNDVSAAENAEEAVCKMASFYVNECQREGVAIRTPTECVKCELEDGRIISEGQNATVEDSSIPQTADVVFIISQNECNQDVVGRVGDIVEQMQRNFDKSGIRDVQFGLVGYGNEGLLNEPHSHTFDGQLMHRKDKFIQALSRFNAVASEGGEDAFHAIRFASKYPFRSGSSKTAILIPCLSCHEASAPYAEMQHLLHSRDINLHVLLQHDFRLRAQSPKTSFIFGVDRLGLFTPKHVGDAALNGDAELRRQVILPKDLCAALTETTDGSTFNIGQLLRTRPAMQKRFVDVLSRLIVKKATPSGCQKCECVLGESGQGTTTCRSCDAEPLIMPWINIQQTINEVSTYL